MLVLIRTDSAHQDFRTLIGLLDQHLNERHGTLQTVYDKFNVVQSIGTVVVAKVDNQPAGCGCFKPFDKDTVEIKRMFVKSEHRGRGIGARILIELENWAAGLGFSRSILETSKKLPEAINLYKKNGYSQIENFGQYACMEMSVCFAKNLKAPVRPPE
jgi:putative acetyltransferase